MCGSEIHPTICYIIIRVISLPHLDLAFKTSTLIDLININ